MISNVKKNILRLIVSKQLWLYVSAVSAAIFLICFLLNMTLISLQHGYAMSTYATNGTFQLYNPLQRLAEGQIIGKDFPFFHGVGVPLLHYPVFAALGSNLFAAETAKWFISPILILFTSLIFFYAYFKNIRKTLISTALFLVVAFFYLLIVYPTNSLIGVRSSFIVLVAAAVLWNSKSFVKIGRLRIRISELFIPILLGLAFACGTEQGLAAIAAFLVVKGIFLLKRRGLKGAILPTLLWGLSILLITFCIISLITQGHPIEALRYALVDIPADQSWYFGAPPNKYLTWSILFKKLFEPVMIPFYVTLVITTASLVFAYRNKALSEVSKFGFAFMLLYGLIAFVVSIFGYYDPQSQLLPFFRMQALIAIALLIQFCFSDTLWERKLFHTLRYIKSPKFTGSLLIVAVVSILSGMLFWQTVKSLETLLSFDAHTILNTAKQARVSDDYFSSNPEWKARIDSFRPFIMQDSSVWSTYASVYDSYFTQSLNPSHGGEDYIIHALGKERRVAYEAQFIADKPEYVITVRPSYSVYESWLEFSHWSLYKQLLTNYEIVTENDAHFLWKLRPEQAVQQNGWQTAPKTDQGYVLPKNNLLDKKIYEVKVEYTASAGLPGKIANKLPRYLIGFKNAPDEEYSISLPSHENTWTFPVVVSSNNLPAVILEANTAGIIPTAQLTIKSLKFREIKIQSTNAIFLSDDFCSVGTNINAAFCVESRIKQNK